MLYDVCKLGHGKEACRYLVIDMKGFACGKLSEPVASAISSRIAEGTLNALGDNCEGLPPEQTIPFEREDDQEEPIPPFAGSKITLKGPMDEAEIMRNMRAQMEFRRNI
jgi:hypothetical protein